MQALFRIRAAVFYRKLTFKFLVKSFTAKVLLFHTVLSHFFFGSVSDIIEWLLNSRYLFSRTKPLFRMDEWNSQLRKRRIFEAQFCHKKRKLRRGRVSVFVFRKVEFWRQNTKPRIKSLRSWTKLDLPWSQKISIAPNNCSPSLVEVWFTWRSSSLFYGDVKRTLSLLLLWMHHSHIRETQKHGN